MIGDAVATKISSPSITGMKLTTVAVIPVRFEVLITSFMIGMPTPIPTIEATAIPTIRDTRLPPAWAR